MSRVMVEFPIEEAEALSGFVVEASDPAWVPASEACLKACQRLDQAIGVERGPGGDAEQPLHERAASLLGRPVRIATTHGEVRGELARVSCSRTLVLRDGLGERPAGLALVTSIEEDREARDDAAFARAMSG